jgi:pimeloyl-ACP methyl ester carboxylesterase
VHAVFVVPGIMGTELLLPSNSGAPDEKVWPPTPAETQFGYKRRDKLASPLVKPGAIILNVLCFDFYKPLLNCLHDLGFTTDGATKRLVVFPYDWRRDLFDTAGALAAALDSAHAAGATRISLVGHSMGGLICRLVLESDTWKNRPWFGSIDQFIAVATPHLGAPLALGRVLGIDSAMGISGADFAWLANNEQFPSAYQLLPAPGEETCWNQADPGLGSLDIYDAGVAQALGLNDKLLKRAKAAHDILGPGNPPPGVRYFFFAATGHRTPTRVNVFRHGNRPIDPAQAVLSRTADGGDGTVPMFSALPRSGQRHVATTEHATAFKGDAFRKVFVRLLGGDEGPALEALVASLALSIEAPVVTVGDNIEVLLHVAADADDPNGALTEIHGELVLQKLRDGEANAGSDVRRVPLAYSGPPIDRLRFYLAPIEEPAYYRLTFEGAPGHAGPEAFGVCAKLPRATGKPGQ